jgi:endonuclease/exonuclease/phosphatase family metal-dependent hydrolase
MTTVEAPYGDLVDTTVRVMTWNVWARCDHLPTLGSSGWGGLVVRAVVDGPRGPILAYCVALDWPPHASAVRMHALRHLAGVIHDDVRATKAAVVVAGDFNAGPDSDEMRMLVGLREPARPGFVLFDAWDHASGSGATWARSNPWAAPTLLPERRIDYVLTGWPRRGGVGSATVAGLAGTEPIAGLVPSDHYAVYADLRY